MNTTMRKRSYLKEALLLVLTLVCCALVARVNSISRPGSPDRPSAGWATLLLG